MGVSEQDTITYSAAISACEKGEAWQHALALFGAMGPAAVEQDTITYNAAISACGKGGKWQHAYAFLVSTGPAAVKHVRLFSGLHVHSSEGKVGFSDFEGKQAGIRC